MNLSVIDILKIDHESTINLDLLNGKKFKNISIDSRTVKPGGLFFAIRGEKLDGHQFIERAVANGAICLVVDNLSDKNNFEKYPAVIVKDTTKALGALASIYRNKFSIPFIAVAGSNGKTTTKEMISNILKMKYSVLNTSGNLNNQFGVPLTLFKLSKKHQIAVIEIGTNHFGEIKYLTEIVNPTHGIITNIGKEHLEYLKNIGEVAKEESEVFNYLKNNGTVFVNADDQLVEKASLNTKNKIKFGFNGNHVRIKGKLLSVNKSGCGTFSIQQNGGKGFIVNLSVPGNHMMQNGLAAAVVGLEFGVSPRQISSALKKFKAVDKRMEIKKIKSITIINDTYNANTESMLSALGAVGAIKSKGKKILILADMLELGASSANEHKMVGKAINKTNCDFLLTLGKEAKLIHENAAVDLKYHYEQKNMLSEYAAGLVSKGDVVLVKGSRGMKMEDVVLFLMERLKNKNGKI